MVQKHEMYAPLGIRGGFKNCGLFYNFLFNDRCAFQGKFFLQNRSDDQKVPSWFVFTLLISE